MASYSRIFRILTSSAILANIAGCSLPARQPVKPSGWYWDGGDDNFQNYPVARYCTTSASDQNTFVTADDAVRLCLLYVSGLKKVAFAEVSYHAPSEAKTMELQSGKDNLTLNLIVHGMGETGGQKNLILRPSASQVWKFLKGKTSVTLFARTLDVAGVPWAKRAQKN